MIGAPFAFEAAGTSARPTADAGADQSQSGLGLVTLDGSGSAAGAGSITTYAWTLTQYTDLGASSDQTGLLSNAAVVGPTFTPAGVGYTYVATLTVTQTDLQTDSDSMTVQIQPASTTEPVASAGGDQTQDTLAQVTLDGSGSSGTGSLVYAWTLDVPPRSATAALSDATAQSPTFTPDVPGIYTATLVVIDDTGLDHADVAIVQVGDDDGYYLLDISAAAKTDSLANEGPSASLGTTSTFAMKNTGAGAWDAGMDGIVYLTAITLPSWATYLLLRMTITTPPVAYNGNVCELGWMVSRTATPTSAEGWHGAGDAIITGDAARLRTVAALGTGNSNVTTNLGAGPHTIDVSMLRQTDDDEPRFPGAMATGASATVESMYTTAMGGAWTSTWYVGPCVEAASAQNAETVWAGVKCWVKVA